MTWDVNTLVQHAIRASERAYAPYSHYRVGAALLSANGTIYMGCNVENAAYPACICGERTALVKAVSEGAQEFTAIAVATINGGSLCGLCRQMLYEFAPDLIVIIVDFEGRVHRTQKLRDLLPNGFGPHDLPQVGP